MENEKVVFNVAEGCNELVIRHGKAVEQLPLLKPLVPNITGTIGAVYEYLDKRLTSQQFEQNRCYIEVDREKVKILLHINDHDEYKYGCIVGRLEMHPTFLKFGINQELSWQPNKLGQFFKMHRSFFKDLAENMDLVSKLKSFEATISAEIRNMRSESGDFSDSYSGVVNSNLPKSFKVNLPIFKGIQADEFEVEFYANVDGKSFTLMLVSPGAMQALEDIRDKVIDDQLKLIKELAPEIAIIEI